MAYRRRYRRNRRPRRRYRRRAPTAKPQDSKGFWGKAARVAIKAVRTAGEIGRAVVAASALPLNNNKIADYVGPLYADGIWTVHNIPEGLTQGTDDTQRLGRQIHVQALALNYRITNGYQDPTSYRVLIIRMQKDYFQDASPGTTSPLPSNFLGFPRYKDVQVLYDSFGSLDGYSSGVYAGHCVDAVKVYKPINQPTHYLGTDGTKPGKGSIYLCVASSTSSPLITMDFQCMMTYHDMST